LFAQVTGANSNAKKAVREMIFQIKNKLELWIAPAKAAGIKP